MKHVNLIRMTAAVAMFAWLAAGYAHCADAHDHDHDHAHEDGHDHDHDHAPTPAAANAGHVHGAGCSHGAAAPTHGLPLSSAEFEVPENSQRLLGLSFVTAEKRHVTGAVRFPGRFELMPNARRIYSAAVPGIVEMHVRPPQRVNAGDTLFTVRSPEWVKQKAEVQEAEASLALVKAEADALRSRLRRINEAGSKNADMEQQLVLKEAEAVRAERARQNVEEALRVVLSLCGEEDGALVFKARDAGVVERVSVEPGAWAETGAEILSVARADGLWFRADGVPAEMVRVRTGQRGFVESLAKDQRTEGRVEVGFAADATARIQPLYLTMETPPEWAMPGRAGVLSVVLEESAAESLAVPHGCVVMDGLQSVVFTRDAKEKSSFFKREVTLGASDGDWVEVQGLEPGAAVVLDGAYELKLAAPSAAGGGEKKKAAGHFHADGQFHEGEH